MLKLLIAVERILTVALLAAAAVCLPLLMACGLDLLSPESLVPTCIGLIPLWLWLTIPIDRLLRPLFHLDSDT